MTYAKAYLAIWSIFFLYWLLHWNGNKRTVQTTNPVHRVLFAAVLFFFFFDRHLLPASWREVYVSHTPAVEITGLVLCAAGVAYAIWARRTLGRNWSANPTIKEDHELIETGPYRQVRHPIYTGILLAIFGSGLGGGRGADLAVFLFCLVSFWFKLKIEEQLMRRQFPQTYPDYMKRTKALVPYLI